jgi:hypothetical protein
MAWLSLRAYAKHRGCALSAVQRAIESGRLSASVARDGRGHPKITDAAAADAEWSATTKDNRVPLAVQLQREAPPVRVPPPRLPPPPGGDDDPELPGAIPDRAVSLARREAAEAALAEIELAEKRGELIQAKDVEARFVAEHSRAKTKILGVPSRARQRDPTLTPAHLVLFEDLLREALEDLAEPDEAPEPAARASA